MKTEQEVAADAAIEAPPIDPASEDAIGAKLREAFSDQMDDPIPQRFVELIKNFGSEANS